MKTAIYIELEELESIDERKKRLDKLATALKAAKVEEAASLDVLWSDEVIDRLVEVDRYRRDDERDRLALAAWVTLVTTSTDRATEIERILRGISKRATVYVQPERAGAGVGLDTIGIERAVLEPPLGSSTILQTHLLSAPAGVGGRMAWQYPGGNGTDVQVVVVEQGWSTTSAELNHLAALGAQGALASDAEIHGTKTLGILSAKDNSPTVPDAFDETQTSVLASPGLIGMVPKAGISMVHDDVLAPSQWLTDLGTTIGGLDNTKPIVVLVELESLDDIGMGVIQKNPIDKHPALQTFMTTTGAGAWFIIPMGNGSQTGGMYGGPPPKAIRVASADYDPSAQSWSRRAFSNYSLAHTTCFGPGDGVESVHTILGNATYGETSAASAVVAGLVVAMRGIAHAKGLPMNIDQAISALKAHGLGVGGIAGAQLVPDLEKIVEHAMGQAVADVFVRDNLADDGTEPSSAPLANSPDILIDLNDPTGTPDPMPNDYVGSGQIPSNTTVYLRARIQNRVPAHKARSVLCRLYYTEPTAFAMPNTWNYIGSTWVDEVGDNPVVTPAIAWDTTSVAQGHYCFIAQLDSGTDPMPNHLDVDSIPAFISLVSNRNNIAWRNFNIVAPAMGGNVLPLWVQGGGRRAEDFRIVIAAELPHDARLEVLAGDGRSLRRFRHRRKIDSDLLEVRGKLDLGVIRLGPDEKVPLLLLVRMPERIEKPHEIAVVQYLGRRELGRVTWRFDPEAKRYDVPKYQQHHQAF